MNAQEYINSKLNSLIKLFPELTFKYKYDKVKLIHIIEVEPLSEFKNNKEYLISEADFVYEFDNTYTPETILFVSEESLTRVNQPDIIIKSNNFGSFIYNLIDEHDIFFDFESSDIIAGENNFALAA
ncbi:hypothetical protein ES705_45863 [subsurface metagenome]